MYKEYIFYSFFLILNSEPKANKKSSEELFYSFKQNFA